MRNQSHYETKFQTRKKFQELTSKYLGTPSSLTQDMAEHYCEELICASQQVFTFSIKNTTRQQEARQGHHQASSHSLSFQQSEVEQQNQHRIIWAGSDRKDHLAPNPPSMGKDTFHKTKKRNSNITYSHSLVSSAQLSSVFGLKAQENTKPECRIW